jgi:hypothetical protein
MVIKARSSTPRFVGWANSKSGGERNYDPTTGAKKNLAEYDTFALVKLETIGAWSENPEKK